jgi:hypothetical protein
MALAGLVWYRRRRQAAAPRVEEPEKFFEE